MPDDKSKAGDHNRTRIDASQATEVRLWALKLGVSADELKAAVRQVGDRADAVEKFLKSKVVT